MTTETNTPNQADASTAFLRAARAGQIEKILSLLSQDVDINVSNANGLNAIHLASKDGHAGVVAELLRRGAAIDAATKKGNTALHIASLAGQDAVVRLLVLNGAQVNIQSQNGFTPLYMAAQENHDSVVKFLLSNGANQSLATEDGFTPLAVAMQQGHEKVVAVLLEADTRGRVRLPALHIAAKKDDVKAANLLLENEHNPDVTSKSGFTPLHIAAHYGNESVARLLLAKGADVNCPAKHNICPLHVAAKWGKDNMVTLLCDNGANVEARTRDGLTPLHCAARSGHERVVEALLERGSPITSKSKNGLAPLHMAAQGDHAEATRVLLARRAPVDDVTVDYLTALHVAAHCGHAKAAKLLLDKNADANARALNGFTPLHIACKKNRIKVVELLLKHGASISATTESGLTPLHVAAFMGCMNIVIYLLQHEASPDVPTVRGETPLHLAARANQTDIIRILLRNGAAVEAKARERQTPLHIASRLGNVDIAVLLLQHGADVRAVTADHYNALHIAAKQHNHDVAAALIEHGAPLTATTKKGFTPLHLAAKYGNLKVANLLLAHGASPDQAGKNGVTPLHVAAQYEQQAVAATLLEKGADAKAVAKNGHTPLHIAARKNQMETAATLLEHGAVTNAESKAGFTPLHLAAQQGHTEMCALLLEHGGLVDHQAKNGLSALHLAAQEDRVPVAQLLVKNNAQVDICSKGGYTPLHVASHFGQTNVVRYLLENGASVKAQTSHGYAALHHAAQQGHINIVNLLLEHKADPNDVTANGQTPLDIAWKLGYVTVMETLKGVSEPTVLNGTGEKYRVVAPETMYETFMSDSEEEGGEDTMLTEQPYRYLTADDMKSLGDDSLPIDVTRDERAESAIGHKNIMEISQTSVNGIPYGAPDEVVVKSVSRYSTQAPEAYCYSVDPSLPNFLVSFLVDAKGGAMRGCRGGGVRVIVPPLSAQQPTRITCRYLKPSRINHMPPLMEGEALASRVLEMGPVSAKFLGPVILEVPHYASLRGKEREIVILRSDNGTSWREHNTEATDHVLQDILHETLEIEESGEDPAGVGGGGGGQSSRVTRILTHDFPQYFAVISRIRQEVHAIGPEGGMVSSSVVPQVQAVFPQGALTKKIKVGLQAQIIDSELTAKLLGRGVAVSPVVTVEPRRRKFHKAITLSMPAPRPHTQGMTNQYSTSSAPTLRLLCSISGGTNRAHWEDVTDNTPLTFVNDCVSFTTTVSARYWLIDCRHVEDATKMATELYKEAIHVPFRARFVVYAKRTETHQAQLRMFCVTDDREDKTLERMERFTQVAKSRDVEVHEGKPCHLEFAGNLVPIAKSGEQLSVPFRAFRENRLSFPVMVKSVHADPVARCQFMREPRVPKGEPSPAPICVLNIVVPDEVSEAAVERAVTPVVSSVADDQDLVWRQRLNDPRLGDICNLLGKDWVALAYELGVSVATVNQIQNKRISAAEQAQLMLKLWRTQSGTKAQDNSLELALCRIGRDDIIAPQSDVTTERRIQRNIYQERQASEEIEAYKADDDNKLKDKPSEDKRDAERTRTESEIHEQEEAKYSPEEKSVADGAGERDTTPSPSEESEDDEDVKRSVAERKVQITRKLSSSKIPASKQKKEIREEILEIKTQIKPVTHETVKLERTRSKTSPESVEEEPELVKEPVKEEAKPVEKPKPQEIKRIDTSSPSKPTPKHLQKHMRNESMHRFSSGDFSDIKITPKKSVPTETIDATKKFIEAETSVRHEVISQKEIATSRVEEKLDDGEKSPDIVMDGEKDVAEAPLKQKISSFESKMMKEQNGELPKTSVKLTKEALKKHTLDHQEQDNEYTQEFVREQAKQVSSMETSQEKVTEHVEKHIETVKSVKQTIQQFDSKIKTALSQEEKAAKTFAKSMRTDSTIVQVSSEEDSEFLKKSTDSETETESQTTVKVDKDKKESKEAKRDVRKEKEVFQEQLRRKVSEEDLVVTVEDKEVLPSKPKDEKIDKKMEPQLSVASTKSDVSKTHTKTDSAGSDLQELVGKKISQESPVPSLGIDKTDSLADLQQSTERDVSFISSQTESKVYSKDSKQRSDSLDEASQFSDLEDQQPGIPSPAHRPTTLGKTLVDIEPIPPDHDHGEVRAQTTQFLEYESNYSARIHTPGFIEKVSPKESPVISAKARHFIETVPEDDSVQECFFSKRIYSDSLEDSEHTDSRRHSEADSLKSDQSDIKVKRSSSDFDERAEYEETVDSGSGFGDEKFEESIGFTSMKFDSTAQEVEKLDSDSDKVDESLFKKMTPKRHSRTESISMTKFSDIQDEIAQAESKPKQEFQIIVTEAEEIAASFEKDESDKISSESSREIEISDRKSSEGVSDKISSEDAVTDKKTSSSEDGTKDTFTDDKVKAQMSVIKGSMKEIEKLESKIQILKDEEGEKVSPVEPVKRQSVTSSGSGTELRLDEKRLSDAHSLTESRDYTFEESEDSFGAHVVEAARDKGDAKVEKGKVLMDRVSEGAKPARLTHGDSLDDVEAFPEDHVIEHVHKLPHIEEVVQQSSFDSKDVSDIKTQRSVEHKRESFPSEATVTASVGVDTPEIRTREVITTYVVSKTEHPVTVTNTVTSTLTKGQKTVDEFMEKSFVTSGYSDKHYTTSTTTTTYAKGERADISKADLKSLEPAEKEPIKPIQTAAKEVSEKVLAKDLDLKLSKSSEVTKEQVERVIDDILEQGTKAAEALTPVIEKDIKVVTKDMIHAEKLVIEGAIEKSKIVKSKIPQPISKQTKDTKEAAKTASDTARKYTPERDSKDAQDKIPIVEKDIKVVTDDMISAERFVMNGAINESVFMKADQKEITKTFKDVTEETSKISSESVLKGNDIVSTVAKGVILGKETTENQAETPIVEKDIKNVTADMISAERFVMEGVIDKSVITKTEGKEIIEPIKVVKEDIPKIGSEIVMKDIVSTVTKGVIPENAAKNKEAETPVVEKDIKTVTSDMITAERLIMGGPIGYTISVGQERAQSKPLSDIKQIAENIEIVIKQASEEQLTDDSTMGREDLEGKVSVDSIIEQAVNRVEEYLDQDTDKKMAEESLKTESRHHPILHKSLSRDSGEGVIIPKKKHPRTYSVQSSPDEVEEQIYTDSESDMDKAKVLEIIEPSSDMEVKLPMSTFDARKLRTDSLDDADDLFPEKEAEYVVVDRDVFMQLKSESDQVSLVQPDIDIEKNIKDITGDMIRAERLLMEGAVRKPEPTKTEDKGERSPYDYSQPDLSAVSPPEMFMKKTHLLEKMSSADKSTTESSVTTVVSTLTKSSDDDHKSVLDGATSADISKISGADLVKDLSKASVESKELVKDDQQEEKDDVSKRSMDLTKDFSKSSIDSKDTSRDFATNELSKDSTADLSKDFSKISGEGVKDSSRSIDEKTFSEDHSSMDLSKTLATDHDTSEASLASKESSKFIDDDRSISKIVEVSSKTYQDSRMSSFGDEHLSFEHISSKTRDDILDEPEEDEFHKDKDQIVEQMTTESDKMSSKIDKTEKEEAKSELKAEPSQKKDDTPLTFDKKGTMAKERSESTSSEEDRDKIVSEMKDLNRLDRRCSDLLEGISQGGALIRIDSSHVTHHHDLTLRFSKTPPPSPVDLVAREKAKVEEGVGDKHTGLQPKGSDSSFLDASRHSPRASSAGDSIYSETEAHQSEILNEASKALSAAATPKSPTRHLADNLSFVNVTQPTIATGAIELVDRTIERSIDVIGQIQQEQLAARSEALDQLSRTSSTIISEIKTESSTSTSSVSKVFEEAPLKFETLNPQAMMADLVAKVGKPDDYSTILTHKQTETHKISGQEYFSETRHVSSSDDDSLVIKTETKHELSGQEHEVKEKTVVRKDGDQTETSQKKVEKTQEATDKRMDVETKSVYKSTDDTDVVLVHREFAEQGLYTGRQTKSEEKMTAIKDDTVKKTNEIKYSERDLSHEQWGKEYFTEPTELHNIEEDEDSSRAKEAFVESSLKIIEKDETVLSSELSEKGKVISAKTEHFKEESIIESKDHDDLSSDISHDTSFRSDTAGRRDSSELSPKSRSKSFKKDDEVYEVNFIKEIKVSTSPVPKTLSRTGSQETHSESEAAAELPHDDKPTKESPAKSDKVKMPVKLPHQEIQDQVWEVSLQKADSFEMAEEIPKSAKPAAVQMKSSLTKSSDSDTLIDDKTVKEISIDTSVKVKPDFSPTAAEASDDLSTTSKELSTTSKDIMIKSGESIDTEYMIKSLESHEGEALQKSMDSTVSAETLHHSEFSTEADSAFLTGTDHKKEELKLVKEKSLEDICSSGYDTDLSSAEFHGPKLEMERVEMDVRSAQPLTDLSVLEKTIDEVKQSLEAAQVEIISEKSDGSSKYKQSPSEFEFKLMSPDKPEVIAEEPPQTEEPDLKKTAILVSKQESQKSDSISHKASSQDETTSDEERDTIQEKERSRDTSEYSCKSDSGPHSILETESEIIISDRDESSKGSPEVKLRINNKHLKTKIGVSDRRSASDMEGYSSSGESHYQSFEHTDSPHSRPLSSDIENLPHSTTDFETAFTTQDGSSRSLRTSKDYYTAASSLTSRDSMRSLDSEGSSHIASIDISDASETLVPSANELKEELMESGTFTDQFMPEGEFPREKPKDLDIRTNEEKVSDDEVSIDEEERKMLDSEEPVGKMKRSHEMRFQPKEMVPEHFPLETIAGSIDIDPDRDDILETDAIREVRKPVVEENIGKSVAKDIEVIPFQISHRPTRQRELVDIESEIIEIGTQEYEEIVRPRSKSLAPTKDKVKGEISEVITYETSSTLPEPQALHEVEETCVQSSVRDLEVVPFPVTAIHHSKREFVDIESEIIPAGTTKYEEISKSSSKSSITKDKLKDDRSESRTSESYPIDSKQSSASSLKVQDQDYLSTPHTPLSMPSQSSESTENGKEYVLDDMFEISETPELKSEQLASERSELVVTTEERTLYEASGYQKDQDSPTSEEFEIVEKPNEMDDFVVIEEVAKEASETDQEGKSLQIKQQKYIKKHDEEVEELLSKASKKQEPSYSTSSSLSDEEMMQYDIEQKRLKAQELAELEAGKKWMQMQFEGDPRYEYERVPLEDIKEEEMTDFDASRIGSLSSQKESVGSYGSFRNSYGSLSESEMVSRRRFMVKGDQDDVSISSLQEFENLEQALMEQYQQHSSSSQDSLNGSLPRRYQLSKSGGDDVSVSSLKEFEGLETACIEALKVEIQAKQKEALLLSQDPKVVSGGFLEHEKRSYSGSSESSPPQKSGSPSQKSGSPSQKSGSPSQKSGSPGQRYGSPSQKTLTDLAAIRKFIDQQVAMEPGLTESATIRKYIDQQVASEPGLTESASIRRLIDQTMAIDPQVREAVIASSDAPSIVVVKKYDDRGAFFTPTEPVSSATKPIEISEECRKSSAYSCIAQKDDMAESLPGDCEEMMKILDQEAEAEKKKAGITRTLSDGGVIEVVRTTKVIQQRFIDGKKVSETITSSEGGSGVDIPGAKKIEYEGSGSARSLEFDIGKSLSSEVSSSATSQQSDMDSLITMIERPFSMCDSSSSTVTVVTTTRQMTLEKPDELDLTRSSDSMMRELSPSSVRSVSQTITSVSGKHFTDPASGSWSGQDEDMSSSGSFSRGARADMMLGSTDSLEATSSNATRATYNYEVDTPMTGSLTSGGSNTMVSSLDTLEPVTAMHMESLEHAAGEHYSHDYDVQEPDSDTERLELDGRAPRAKERTIMFDSTDTLSAVSGDGSVREAAVEAPAPTFFIGDTPILRGERGDDVENMEGELPVLSGSCPASLPPLPTQPPPPVPAQRRSLTMIAKSPPSSQDEAPPKK